jgi:predicted ATPase
VICPITFGCQPQLPHLSRLVDQLATGRGGTVLVTGEAGIGKTRLAGEARSLASTRAVRVLQGSAFELDRALPYGRIIDLLRAFIAGQTHRTVMKVVSEGGTA